MSEELNESQETLIPDNATEVAVDPDVELDIEALKAKAEKADEYKKYADRVAAENAKLKKPKESLQTNQSSPDSDERFERLDLKTEGYSSSEVDFLMRNGGRKALEDPIVMAGIDSIRKKVKSENATPSGTAKSTVFQKFTEQDLKKMSLEDLEKIIPQ